ncbi:MAG: sugar phosphate isomerase/epimerase [Ignavibacterium sp.]|jgi:sugar phosphate isomerase/epimerase
MKTLELGIVSDEISPDFAVAVKYAVEWDIRIVELRMLQSGRVPSVQTAEIKSVGRMARENGIRISALSPGIFKHTLSQTKEVGHEIANTLPRTIDLAGELGTNLIIVFGFQQENNEDPGRESLWLDAMRRAAEIAGKAGMDLAIENEPGFWCSSGATTAGLLKKAEMKNLGANWDPCNAYGAEPRPYPDGYQAVKEFVRNVHVKDTLEGSLIRCVPVGEGAIDWKGQMEALMRDAIVSHVTIETHCLPLIEKSKQNVETLRRYLAEQSS